jgi:acetyl-CoA C-acetyltransferase
MHRSEHWKLGFVGSRCTACGAGQLPPQRVCSACGAIDQSEEAPFANRTCRIATYTLDHLAYSLQPPTVAAVLDFEGGGRLACELTDMEPAKVAIGDELEMTFRRLYTGQGVHNYFWKARPRRRSRQRRRRARPQRWREHGQQRHQGPRRDRGHGLHEVRRALGPGRRRPARRRGGRGLPLGGRRPAQVDAYWLGTMGSGTSGLVLSEALKLDVQAGDAAREHVRHGQRGDAQRRLRGGVGRLRPRDGDRRREAQGLGLFGLVGSRPPDDGTGQNMSAPAMFSLLAPAYAKKYGVSEGELKEVIARIAWKNHVNGAKNPKAQFQKEVPMEQIMNSPRVAGMFGVFDCSGVSDGSAAAILCRAEDAHKYTDHPIFIKALSFVAGPAEGYFNQDYDFTTFQEVVASSQDAYSQAGVTNPREQISMAEVHDCFTATELVLMEDMGFSERGKGWQDVLAGASTSTARSR